MSSTIGKNVERLILDESFWRRFTNHQNSFLEESDKLPYNDIVLVKDYLEKAGLSIQKAGSPVGDDIIGSIEVNHAELEKVRNTLRENKLNYEHSVAEAAKEFLTSGELFKVRHDDGRVFKELLGDGKFSRDVLTLVFDTLIKARSKTRENDAVTVDDNTIITPHNVLRQAVEMTSNRSK